MPGRDKYYKAVILSEVKQQCKSFPCIPLRLRQAAPVTLGLSENQKCGGHSG